MKVPEIKSRGSQPAKSAKRTGKANKGNFTNHLTSSAAPLSEASAPEEAAPVAPVNSILTLQEVGVDSDADPGKTQQGLIRWGENIIEQLEQIRHDILVGAIPVKRLTNLAQTLRDRKSNISDPRLLSLIREIELRAEVEIAKYSRDIAR